jgi:hypothetical protein
MPNNVLYKYRSLDNWKYLIDILVGERLYAASFRSLNDPMEGRYHYTRDEVSRAFDRAIRQSKDYWRICSLTTKATSTLMWSYYAGGHTGVAVGVVVPKRRGQRMLPVRYDSDVYVGPGHFRRQPRDVALEILSQKQWAWSHEGEVRVFSKAPFVPIQVHSLLLGCQISEDDEKLVQGLVRAVNPKVTVRRIKRSQLDAPLDVVGRNNRPRRSGGMKPT